MEAEAEGTAHKSQAPPNLIRKKQASEKKLACATEVLQQISGRHEQAKLSGKLLIEVRYNNLGHVTKVVVTEQNTI